MNIPQNREDMVRGVSEYSHHVGGHIHAHHRVRGYVHYRVRDGRVGPARRLLLHGMQLSLVYNLLLRPPYAAFAAQTGLDARYTLIYIRQFR